MLGKLILSILFIAAAGTSDNPSIELTFSGDGDVSFALTGNWSASAPTPVPAPTPALAPTPTPAHVHGTAVVACDDEGYALGWLFGSFFAGGIIVQVYWNNRMDGAKQTNKRSGDRVQILKEDGGTQEATLAYRPVQRDIQFV